MVTRSANIIQKEFCPEVELLNQACLDMVAQIEQLKKENSVKKNEGERKWVWEEIKG